MAKSDEEVKTPSIFRGIMDTVSCFCGSESEESRVNKKIDDEIKKTKKNMKQSYKLLLLGAGESGKSTIVKQMKILHINGFSNEERAFYAENIRGNLRDAILTISEALTTLNPSIPLELPENQERVDWILDNASQSDFDYPLEFYEHTEVLWKDAGIQQAYDRNNEYQLIDCAKYFLDKVNEIKSPHYVPSEQDILRCRILTTTIIETKFEINKVFFNIIDVGGQTDERRKWVQCFHDVTAVIFVSSVSSYNMVLREDASKNRLKASLDLFQNIWTNRWLCTRSVILFLNKRDLLTEKIQAGKSKLEDYFPEYANYRIPMSMPKDPVKNSLEPTEVRRAMYFIYNEFLNRSNTPTKGPINKIRDIYAHYTCAVDTENIKRVFNSCRDIIQRIYLVENELL